MTTARMRMVNREVNTRTRASYARNYGEKPNLFRYSANDAGFEQFRKDYETYMKEW